MNTIFMDTREAGSPLEAAPRARLLVNHGMPVRMRTYELTGRKARRAKAAIDRKRKARAPEPGGSQT